mmetsp:Transcript_38664/g.106767  ORF Transcript_38664/g.106767 Transcript_38664/m.106767 type:complete len:275 (-) Transcript_38664:201-1025(-)
MVRGRRRRLTCCASLRTPRTARRSLCCGCGGGDPADAARAAVRRCASPRPRATTVYTFGGSHAWQHGLYSRWIAGGTAALGHGLGSEELMELNKVLCGVLRPADEQWWADSVEADGAVIFEFDARAPPATRCVMLRDLGWPERTQPTVADLVAHILDRLEYRCAYDLAHEEGAAGRALGGDASDTGLEDRGAWAAAQRWFYSLLVVFTPSRVLAFVALLGSALEVHARGDDGAQHGRAGSVDRRVRTHAWTLQAAKARRRKARRALRRSREARR